MWAHKLTNWSDVDTGPFSSAGSRHGLSAAWQRCESYLLEGLVELALLQELQDVGLLCLVVEVCCGNGRSGRRPHGLHDAGGDHRLLLLHGQADFAFDDPLHVADNGLLQTGEDRRRITFISSGTGKWGVWSSEKTSASLSFPL